MVPQIHKSSIISPDAIIGDGTYVAEFVSIQGNAKIGKNCHIDVGVVIESDTQIGNNTKIYQNSVIRKNSILGNDCILGKGIMIENQVKLGNEVHIVDLTHISHTSIIEDNVFIGPGVITDNTANVLSFRNKSVELKGPIIKHGSRIGTASILAMGVTIGKNAVVGRGSLVMKNIPDGQLWYGHPAKYVRDVPEEEYV